MAPIYTVDRVQVPIRLAL